jgi:hypothetical protein
MRAYICHVCGYPELEEPPWGDKGEASSFNICPCCDFEFGYEDSNFSAYENNKQKWLSSGARWFDEEIKPSEWCLEAQLKNIEIIPNYLLPDYLKIRG